MTASEWVQRFSAEIGAEPPGEEEFEAILYLAAEAAHASERIAAPVACYIAGASGRSLKELNKIAKQVAPGG